MEDLAHTALAHTDEIARADADAVALLTRSLIDSGLEMAAFGSSAPGGGSEHHISHCWEMRMLRQGCPRCCTASRWASGPSSRPAGIRVCGR